MMAHVDPRELPPLRGIDVTEGEVIAGGVRCLELSERTL
jgi:hypothetical protein